jgi:N-hydroxyarylamine O-acetyltransferase
VARAHRELSAPPDGQFARVLAVQRRDELGAEALRGIRHQRRGAGAFTREPERHGGWRAALTSLGVSLGAADGELRSLHARMRAAHAVRTAAAAAGT